VKALSLAVVLACSAAWAQPADAPVVEPTVTLTEGEAIAAAKRLAACEAKVPVLEAGLQKMDSRPPWWVLPVVAVVAAGVGLGIGLTVKR